jgi:hypothetical protein
MREGGLRVRGAKKKVITSVYSDEADEMSHQHVIAANVKVVMGSSGIDS